MDIQTIRIAVTVGAFIAFLGIVAWAYAPSRRRRFDDDARLPFDERDPGDRT